MSSITPSVTEAFFGEIPPEMRRRFGLDPAGGAEGTAGQSGRNAGIKAAKAAGGPPTRPGAPSSPWQLGRASWIELGKRVVREISKDRVTSVAAGVTFFSLLALFPAITALVSIYGLFADQQTVVENLNALQRILPGEAIGLIREQVVKIAEAPAQALGIATVIGLLTALYSSMGGMKALIEALNIAWFQSETRGFVRLNLLALALTLGAIMLIITLVVAIAVLYRFAPDKDDNAWHWISPGAVVATFGLVVASLLFSWYAANFANYNETYGSLGAAIALMMWLWIACTVVLVGAEINSEVERQIQKENGIPLEDDRAKDKD